MKIQLQGKILESHARAIRLKDQTLAGSMPSTRFVARKESFGGVVYSHDLASYVFFTEDAWNHVFVCQDPTAKGREIEEELKRLGFDPMILPSEARIIQNEQIVGALSAPLRVYLDAIYACNLSCGYCYNKIEEREEKILPLAKLEGIFAQMAAAGIMKLSIAGGEPLVDKRIFEIIAAARNNGLTVSMTTNGTVLNERIINGLRGCGLKRLTVSVDSADPQLAEQSRPGLNFAKWRQNLSVLGSIGLDISLKCTFNSNFTSSDIDHLINFANDEKSVDSIKFNFERDLDVVRRTADRNEVRRYFGLWKHLKDAALSSKKPVILNQRNPIAYERSDVSQFIGIGCPAGRDLMYINPYGDVKGCALLPTDFVSGNLQTSSLLDIWRGSAKFSELRSYPLGDKCNSCEFLNVCRGGCTQRRILNGGMDVNDYYCFRDVAEEFETIPAEIEGEAFKHAHIYDLAHL
jgi:radical SAM protein with 4Fe4S-binding SPASM domain